jgi:flagellar biosynthetic protein FliS
LKDKAVKTPYKSYSTNQIDNACPGEQIAALFDMAAEHIIKASEAIAQNDIQARYDYSQKALAIIEGLMACLNRDTPERAQAASSLELYYTMMITMISRINIYNDPAICLSLESSFKDMANFWRNAVIQLSTPQNDICEQSQPAIINA